VRITLLCAVLALAGTLSAAPINVLWWDSTPDYGGQAPNALRQEMSDYLTAFGGGGIFSSTYVGSETPGTLATHLATNSYHVLVFDATSSSSKFNAADIAAVQAFYATMSNLLFDGTLYIRSINYDAGTNFPGPGGDTGRLTANEVYQLGTRGGGIMVGTDHNCCQVDANQIVQAVLPGASFSGVTFPSTDGIWNGTDLLTGAANVVSLNVFNHWDSVPTQAIAPTGTFMDINGASVTLYSQVDVADDPGGGPKFSYISTSWQPSGGGVIITDPDPGGGGGGVIPEPSTYVLMASAMGALWFIRRRR
jgi:hypothetical protein